MVRVKKGKKGGNGLILFGRGFLLVVDGKKMGQHLYVRL